MVNYPFQVLELQVGNSNVSYHSFFTQLNQSRQSLINYLIQIGKFNIVYIYQIDKIYIQTFHALIHTFCRTFCRVIPQIYSIFSITSHFGRKVITVTRKIF